MSDPTLDKLFKNSEKAKLMEAIDRALPEATKVIVVLITDKEDSNSYHSTVLTLGLNSTYEAFGILEVAKQDLENEGY